MASSILPPTGIALQGAPDTDIGTKDAKGNAVQVMQLEMTQTVVDELLECVRSGKPPQILFGRAPVCLIKSSLAPCYLRFTSGHRGVLVNSTNTFYK